MRGLSWLPLLFFLVLLVLLPLAFSQLFTAALIKLKLDPPTALLVVIGMFLGSAINIPVKRISREESVPVDPLAVFGLQGWWPSIQRVHRETIIAVNVDPALDIHVKQELLGNIVPTIEKQFRVLSGCEPRHRRPLDGRRADAAGRSADARVL